MRTLILILCIFTGLNQWVQAAGKPMLKPLEREVFERQKSLIRSDVASDARKDSTLHFDEEQSFSVLLGNESRHNLIPVTYNSIQAKNNVCMTYVISPSDQLIGKIPLHFKVGNNDEIVETCIGVNAVSVTQSIDKQLLIYLLRVRYGNSFADRVFVGTIAEGAVQRNEALTKCVSRKKSGSISAVKMAIKQCGAYPPTSE